jgi:hypothetical protein
MRSFACGWCLRGLAIRLLVFRERQLAIAPSARGHVALVDTRCLANVKWALLPVQKLQNGHSCPFSGANVGQ